MLNYQQKKGFLMFEGQQIEFPVDWNFRIIAEASADVSDALIAVLKSFGIQELPKTGNVSRNGKYQSYQVKVTFQDKATMDLMGVKFAEIPGVKTVI